MSHHRDLKNAQAEMNEAVTILLRTGAASHRMSSESYDFVEAYEGLLNSWETFTDLQAIGDARGAASARDTSIAASYNTLPRAASLRGMVCDTMFTGGLVRMGGLFDDLQVPIGGRTCDELERKLHRTHQSVSSAVNYAESHGWIKDSGYRRTTRSASKAIVFEPTDKLVAEMAKRRRVA